MHNKWTFRLTVVALLAVLNLAGCYEPVNFPQLAIPPKPPVTILPVYYRIIGTSVQGNPLLCQVIGLGSDVTLVIATIHGSEPAGTPLVRRLAKYLQENPELVDGRTVVLFAVANPDGMMSENRYNAHDVDLNRNFEAANRVLDAHSGQTALSEPESRAIRQLVLDYKPDRIVTLHQPLACIDYDGPAGPLASRMADYCDLPVKKVGARPGSLGSYAGVTLGIPIVTFEMLPTDSKFDTQALWERYGKALVAAVVYPDRVSTKHQPTKAALSAGK